MKNGVGDNFGFGASGPDNYSPDYYLLIFEHLKTLEAMLCPLAVCRSSCTCTTPPNLAALPSRLRRANWLPLSMAAAHLLALECSASAQLNNRQMEPTLEPKPALTTSLDSQPPKYCP